MAQTAIPMTLEFASVADLEKFRDRFEEVRQHRLPEGIQLWGESGTESPSASEEESRQMTIWWFRDNIAAPFAVGVVLGLLFSPDTPSAQEPNPPHANPPYVQVVNMQVVNNYYDLSQDYSQDEYERKIQGVEPNLIEELDKAAEESEEPGSE